VPIRPYAAHFKLKFYLMQKVNILFLAFSLFFIAIMVGKPLHVFDNAKTMIEFIEYDENEAPESSAEKVSEKLKKEYNPFLDRLLKAHLDISHLSSMPSTFFQDSLYQFIYSKKLLRPPCA
jgi:hypothetical protein